MESIYRSPLRVYLCFAILLLMGFICFTKIPIALFPNSSKPEVSITVPFGKFTRDSFLNTYGRDFEGQLRGIQTPNCTTERVEAYYNSTDVFYSIFFRWGDSGDACLKEASQVLSAYKSRWPQEIQESSWVWLNAHGTGFFFGTISSAKRGSEELYNLVEPLLGPKLAAIKEASEAVVFNPEEKSVTIELSPLKMAGFKIKPDQIFTKIRDALTNFGGGVLSHAGHSITIEIGSNFRGVDDLEKILVSTDASKRVFLGELADVRYEVASNNRRVFKINGAASVGVWATPAPGRNIKVMAEKVLQALDEAMASDAIPKDVHYSVAINPATFIDESVSNVMHEVWLCSLIAVLVLFIFIGSFFGTLTALIEIPTSIVLSFILMKATGVQLNLVSMGGLALSVGMNVDASIVVIDSIIKRFQGRKRGVISNDDVVGLVTEAVREVKVPVVAATITSLVVFIPLVFTSNLSYAILGDLAKAVIYSHSISLFIAMILVPTVRIHMANRLGSFAEKHSIGWLDRWLDRLYDGYCRALAYFMEAPKLRNISYATVALSIVAAAITIPARLPREIIGKPASSIISVNLTSPKSTQMGQMEETAARFERMVHDTFGEKIDFVFTQVWAIDRGYLSIHLRNKHDYQKTLETLQELTKNDMETQFNYSPFNPAELPIPNPPDWRVTFANRSPEVAEATRDAFRLGLLEHGIVDDVQEDSASNLPNRLQLQPYDDKFALLSESTNPVFPSDVAAMVNLATGPVNVGRMVINNRVKTISARYPDQLVATPDEIAALPIRANDRILPLRALSEFKVSREAQRVTRINGEHSIALEGYFSEKEKKIEPEVRKRFNDFVEQFHKEHPNAGVSVVDAKVELSKALSELEMTVGLSMALIFLVLLLQFSSVVHTLIVMLAIPFGIFGVLVSLFGFHSTLSLNSGLGIILLVGITVANSIMLVEMILRLVEDGVPVRDAILETARKRIRPILMTSLITILGMLPVAIGFGEGGKVLQPLGIAVCGGLWVSLIFTLFFIPALEYSYLKWKK